MLPQPQHPLLPTPKLTPLGYANEVVGNTGYVGIG